MEYIGNILVGEYKEWSTYALQSNQSTSTFTFDGSFDVYNYATNTLLLTHVVTITKPASFPVSAIPNTYIPVFTYRFSPTVPGKYVYKIMQQYLASGDVTIRYKTSYVTFDAIEAPTLSLSVQPFSIVFPDTIVDGDSETRDVIVVNNGESSSVPADVSITALTLATHYELVGAPTLPYVMHVGDTLTLKLRFSPTSSGDKTDAHALTITSSAPQSPQYVAAVGYCYTTAINAISGFDTETLFAFAYGAGPTVVTKLADSDDLNCEEIQQLNKLFDFGLAGIDKVITDVFFMYENLGVASLAATVNRRVISADSNYSNEREVVIGSADADQRALSAKANGFLLDGQVLELALYKDANSGPISLVEMIIKYLVEEKLLGGYTLPLIGATSHIVNMENTNAVFFFATDVNVASAKRADPVDLNCEEAGYFERLSTFELDGQEKGIMRVWLKVEDKGSTTLSLTPSSPHGAVAADSNTFGGGAVVDDILNVAFNFIISGEMVKLRFDRAANTGAISIISYLPRVEPRGEVKE
jgi:hypothetical protein